LDIVFESKSVSGSKEKRTRPGYFLVQARGGKKKKEGGGVCHRDRQKVESPDQHLQFGGGRCGGGEKKGKVRHGLCHPTVRMEERKKRKEEEEGEIASQTRRGEGRKRPLYTNFHRGKTRGIQQGRKEKKKRLRAASSGGKGKEEDISTSPLTVGCRRILQRAG